MLARSIADALIVPFESHPIVGDSEVLGTSEFVAGYAWAARSCTTSVLALEGALFMIGQAFENNGRCEEALAT